MRGGNRDKALGTRLVRGESLEPVLNNYMELWEWSLDICKDTEMKARIRGVQGMMTTFPFYFGCTLGAFILKHTDNLSHALQSSFMSARQRQQVAEEVCKTLSRDRSEAAFDSFWTRLLKRKRKVDTVSDPQLPRKRLAPAREEVGDSCSHYFPSTLPGMTYLRSTTGEGRLNLILLHVHKELSDGIDMVEVANLFVGDNQRPSNCLGSFQTV